jgi:branched-chain amino acid aminotransferase
VRGHRVERLLRRRRRAGTPTLASGCLAGISRALLLEWYGAAPLAGVALREVDEPVEVLTRAEEIFLVSTTRDVQAVHQCNGRNLFAPGPVTASCQELWAQREAADSDP